MIKKPKLVLFDFGGTLFEGTPFNVESGMEALRKAADNPDVVTTEELCDLWRELDGKITAAKNPDSGMCIDIELSQMFRNIFSRTGLKFSISMLECEHIFDCNNAVRKKVKGITEFINVLNEQGIRTGVISNVILSGDAMRLYVDRYLQNNKFERILTSADYLLCKPASDLFEAALKIYGISAEDCWYCGDDRQADVDGANGIGIYPVLIRTDSDIPFENRNEDGKEYSVVNSWKELIKFI